MVLERRQSIISRPTNRRLSDVNLIISVDKPPPSVPGDPTIPSEQLWSSTDYTLELEGNVEYHNGLLVGATKDALIRKLTPVNPPIDSFLCRVFFLTFRLLFTPKELAEALVRRYFISPPRGLQSLGLVPWQSEIRVPIRRQVFRLLEIWLEMYWVPGVDDDAISPLKALIKERSTSDLSPWPAYIVGDLLHKRTPREDTVDFDISKSRAGVFLNQVEAPEVRMSRTLGASLPGGKFKKIKITDFDPLELARQLTILESKLFCAVRPEDILGNPRGDLDLPVPAKSLQDIEFFGDRIKHWVAESILQPHRFTTRGTKITFFIRVASHCVKLNNFATPRSILQALEEPEVSRLGWAFRGLPKRYQLELNNLRNLVGESDNHVGYRMKLQSLPSGPAIPRLDMFLFDIRFCLDHFPDYRVSPFKTFPARQMINLTKCYRLVEIYEDMTRFQVPFNLELVSGFDNYMNAEFRKVERRKKRRHRSKTELWPWPHEDASITSCTSDSDDL